MNALDEYCRTRLGQEVRKNLTRAYVLVREGQPAVLGYYTLSTGSIKTEGLPVNFAKKIPYEACSTALLGRMAVHSDLQGQRLGSLLVMDALYKCFEASQKIGIWGVIVDAKTKDLVRFYQKLQFIHFPEASMKLYLPMATVKQMFGG